MGDWNEAGNLNIGVFGQGQWLLDLNGDYQWTGAPDQAIDFGFATDKPVVTAW